MPLYEYKCDDCGQRFEKIQKFSDPPVSTCLFCSGKVKKLVSSAAIQFKGTGWYVTDYGPKKTSSEQADSSGDRSGSAGTNDSSGDRPGSAKTNDSSKRESSKDEKTPSDKTASSEKTPKPSSSEKK